MIRTPLLLALLLGTSASGIALAADTPATPAPRPAKLDTNGDGVIDRSEAAANPRLAAKFDELDKNKDGKLSRDELPRWQHGRRGHGGERWAALDVNKDGRISREEAKADPRLAGLALVRQSRLSVMPVGAEHWAILCDMAGWKDEASRAA